MEVLVCIKQVPDPEHFAQIVLDPVTRVIRREGVPVIMNPADRRAVEAALRIRDQFSGEVTVLTMGPPQARESLEEALAMGADGAVLLCDGVFAAADAFATAFTLAAAVKKFCPFDIILCGNETVDSGTKIVAPQLAEFLDIPYATNVKSMSFRGEDACLVERPMENGYMKVELQLPALVAVNKAINEPRIPDVFGIMQVASKPLSIYGFNDLGVPPDKLGLAGSPTRVADIFEMKHKRLNEIIQGEAEEVARNAIARLRELHAL